MRIAELKKDLAEALALASASTANAAGTGTSSKTPTPTNTTPGSALQHDAESYRVEQSITLSSLTQPYTIKTFEFAGLRKTVTVKPGVVIEGATFNLRRGGKVVV